MEWLSTFLSLFGLGRDRALRIADRRAEAFRLASEVGGDVGQALDLIETGRARLLARCAMLCPNEPEAADACDKALAKIRDDALTLQAQAEDAKRSITTLKGNSDWERLIRKLTEWRATSSRLVPWVAGEVRRFDEVLDQRA